MKLGCCAYSKDRSVDPVGLASVPVIKKLGFDYVELTMSGLASLSDEQFEKVLDILKKLDIRCEVLHGFFPGSMRLTGPAVDLDAIHAFLAKALPRAKAVGAGIIVFGSPGARNYPDGFPKEKAYEQLVELCRLIEPYAAKEDIVIAIDPLQYGEANIINTVRDGYQLAKDTDRPHIRLLVDYFHWVRNGETLEDLKDCADLIVHAHFAENIDRAFPSEKLEIYRSFMETFKATGYDARISLEAHVKTDFETEAGNALKLFRENYL